MMMGVEVGEPRPPLPLLDERQRADLRNALIALDAIPAVEA